MSTPWGRLSLRRTSRSEAPVVAVTGAAGRIGRACLRALAASRFDVIAVDLDRGTGRAQWRVADLRRPDEARRAVAGATHVIHLAGHTAPIPGKETEVLLDNIGMTANVLDAFSAGSPQGVVIASSVTVYGMVWSPTVVSPDYVPVDEEHPCRPADSYGLSKLVMEEMAAAWTRRTGVTTVALRFPWASGAEPQRIAAFLDQIAADPMGEIGRRHLWSYVHADDVAMAFVQALEIRDGGAHVLNIASEEVVGGGSGSDLVATCHPATEVRGDVAQHGFYSTARAHNLLGWRPTRTLLADTGVGSKDGAARR